MAKSSQRKVNDRRSKNTPPPELPPWIAPTEGRRVKNIPSPLDGDYRVFEHIETVNGRLVEFAIMIQKPNGEDWYDIIRADCDHHEVHIHVFVPSASRKIIRKINTQNDVIEGYHEAKTAVYDAYEAMEERS